MENSNEKLVILSFPSSCSVLYGESLDRDNKWQCRMTVPPSSRSVPANAADAIYCMMLGQNAAHAAMAGYTSRGRVCH
jgi:hypothetical protein